MESEPVPSLEEYRNYLRVMVELQVGAKLRGKLDPSGVIQQTLLDAYTARADLGTDVKNILPWLRRILANNLSDEIRKIQSVRRGGGRDLSLEQSLEQSSLKFAMFLAHEQVAVSNQLIQQEQILKLTAAMAALPESQREALILQHWQGHKLAEIAEKMGRSRVAVAGLIKRAIQTLRESLIEME